MIKAYVIDPRVQTVEEVSYPAVSFREINMAIGSDAMDMGYMLPSRDLVWVDDEGMLKAEDQNGDSCFVIGDSPLLFGRALVTGPEDSLTGSIVSVRMSIDHVREAITWRGNKRLMGFNQTEGTIIHPVFGPIKSLKRTPILKDIP